ncbi:hypothetical protein QVD17_05913 [Tagetes erecta]|uniref:Acid phosphatase/vanadium-dependent haloperoxidase-related protein n=1 Tax=Tagetes erecta TaxID=13708 RepID=A0AAD8PAW8_TARER|nr:hypothetical protein QVD17_05913 [Tagetes erecta]
MLLHSWTSSSRLLLQFTSQSISIGYEPTRLHSTRRYLKASSTVAFLRSGTDVVVEIAHNKVLIAAAVCAAAGQLAKPFTGSIFYGREFDPKAAISAGGFPSTHSSAAVAAAMSIGLERGFSDSIFGLAVVYAALTMYDAQGVRREVGVHARTLNKALTKNQPNTYASSAPNRLIESSSKKLTSSLESDKSLMLEKRVNSSFLTNDSEPVSENNGQISGLLKESIGHTKIEVAAGALLGVLASLAVYTF